MNTHRATNGAVDAFKEEASDRLKVLRAALEKARERVPGAEATVRRMARSVARAAEEHGLIQLESRAENLADADTRREMFARSRVLLEAVDGALPGPDQARILIVEDEPTTALLLESVIAADDRTIDAVGTAAEALAFLDRQTPDLVLLDLVLPDADGRDVLLRLRERPASSDTPVIVMSARPATEARDECLALGAQEYLQKPVDGSTTRAVVDAELARARGRAGPGSASGFADRAAISQAFEAARATSGGTRPVVVVNIAFDDLESAPGERRTRLWEASAEVRDVLRPGDLLSEGRDETILALLFDIEPDDVNALLESADPCRVGLRAGIAAVGAGATLASGIARSERLLSLARAPDMPRLLASEQAEGGRAPRVLLVEDDPVTATLVNHRLTKDGFEVEHFEDGEEALEAARSRAFALGLFDVKLGGMDGFELLQRVRALEHFRGVPILMLTSMGKEADVVRGFDLGADDYVLKPFSPVELVARINRLLDA
ncbi:MAG: response regulator [Gemmatimonadetes bacterium]|nr:response regulator [Gemmatimonadota bacterium]